MEFYYDEIQDDVMVIKADGGLNADTAAEFVTSIESLVEAGLRKVVVDCTQLDYISSYGLGILVRLNKRMKKHGGDVKMAGVKGLIVEVLRLTRLASLFEIYPDVNRALLAFRPVEASSDQAGL